MAVEWHQLISPRFREKLKNEKGYGSASYLYPYIVKRTEVIWDFGLMIEVGHT
jgi:hypothetical protein